MNPRHLGLFSLVILLALAATGSSTAQSKLPLQAPFGRPVGAPPSSTVVPNELLPSHQPLIDITLDPANAKTDLERRLRKAKSDKELDKLLQQMLKDFKPEDLTKLTKEDLQKLQNIAKQQNLNHAPNLDDKQLASLKDKLKDLNPDQFTQKDLEDLKQIQKQQQGQPLDLTDPFVQTFMETIGKNWANEHPDAKDTPALQEWLKTQTNPDSTAGASPALPDKVPHIDGPTGGPAGKPSQVPTPNWPPPVYGKKPMGATGPTPPSWLGKQFLSLVGRVIEVLLFGDVLQFLKVLFGQFQDAVASPDAVHGTGAQRGRAACFRSHG